MSNEIADGTGKGFKVKIDSTNKIASRSVSESTILEAMGDGRAFRVGSGVLTLTTANESAILYLKNNDSRDMLLYEIITIVDVSTGGSGTNLSGFTLNPTGGTIQAEAAAVVINLNTGSNNVADVTATVGSEGKTATGSGGNTLFPEVGRLTLKDQIIMPKGTDLALRFTPPSGNSSQKVQTVIKFYFIEEV